MDTINCTHGHRNFRCKCHSGNMPMCIDCSPHAKMMKWEVIFLDPTRDDHPLCKMIVDAKTKGRARNVVRKRFPGYIVAFMSESQV